MSHRKNRLSFITPKKAHSFSTDHQHQDFELPTSRNPQQYSARRTKSPSASQQFTLSNEKLPQLGINKVLRKIGAIDTKQQAYIPCETDQAQFRSAKLHQLREMYAGKRVAKQLPFEHELDPIVLDCWKYGESFGRKTVWRKYRQNFDELTYDTLMIMRKRKA